MPSSQGKSQKAAANPGRHQIPEWGKMGHQVPSCQGPCGFQGVQKLTFLRKEQGGTDKHWQQSQTPNLVRKKGQILQQRNHWGRKEVNQIYNFQGLLSSFPASTAHALTVRLGFDSFSSSEKKCWSPGKAALKERGSYSKSVFTHTKKCFNCFNTYYVKAISLRSKTIKKVRLSSSWRTWSSQTYVPCTLLDHIFVPKVWQYQDQPIHYDCLEKLSSLQVHMLPKGR